MPCNYQQQTVRPACLCSLLASRSKQDERARRIGALTAYRSPLSAIERDMINKPIEDVVADVHKDPSRASALLGAYAKVAFKAHDRTNCLTEVLVKDAERWIKDGSVNLKGPLAGIPVSRKDTIGVEGYNSTVGMTCNVGRPKREDGATVRLLKELGAVPYVKTNVPITLLSFESANDVWGRSTNPFSSRHTPGGSTGGRTGIGSDVASSVRSRASTRSSAPPAAVPSWA